MDEYTPKHSNNEPKKSDTKKSIGLVFAGAGTTLAGFTAAQIIPIIIATILIAVAVVWAIIEFLLPLFDINNNDKYKTDGNKDTSSITSMVLPPNPIDFKAIQQENPDVCAWIQIPGIETIDYPILQSSPEADDNYYLDHDMNGKSKRAGSIYIQKLNNKDFTDPATIIYGHNMLNGTMFGQLKKYRTKSFFDEHQEIYIYMPGHILKYELVSAFVYDDRHILNSFNFDVEDDRMKFFNECTNPTSLTKQVVEGAELDVDDEIIVLSTCTANDSERYLVVAKFVSDTVTER